MSDRDFSAASKAICDYLDADPMRSLRGCTPSMLAGVVLDALRPSLPDLKGGCACTVHTEDAGCGYREFLLEYEPACPEHSQHLYDPRLGEWIHRPEAEGVPHIEAGPVSFGDDGFEVSV